jgi:hypothetical protein
MFFPWLLCVTFDAYYCSFIALSFGISFVLFLALTFLGVSFVLFKFIDVLSLVGMFFPLYFSLVAMSHFRCILLSE